MENKKLEHYLTNLEKSLGVISISEKAEIITEIKSHVLDALENSEKSMTEVLEELGRPEQVASKYLLERGLELQKPPRHPLMKWLIIGFLGTLGIIAVFVAIIIWRFTPLVHVDEEKGQVKIMGGMINVNGNSETLKNLKINKGVNDFTEQFSGERKIDEELTKIFLKFSNTSLKIKPSEGKNLQYECETNGTPRVSENKEELIFNFKSLAMADCLFFIPADIDIEVNASNGKFNFYELQNNLIFEGANGRVKFKPHEQIGYDYDVLLRNGKRDAFQNSKGSKTYKVKISLINGRIEN